MESDSRASHPHEVRSQPVLTSPAKQAQDLKLHLWSEVKLLISTFPSWKKHSSIPPTRSLHSTNSLATPSMWPTSKASKTLTKTSLLGLWRKELTEDSNMCKQTSLWPLCKIGWRIKMWKRSLLLSKCSSRWCHLRHHVHQTERQSSRVPISSLRRSFRRQFLVRVVLSKSQTRNPAIKTSVPQPRN